MQMTELFGWDKSVNSRHIRHVFSEGERDLEIITSKLLSLLAIA